jgi:tetrachlorobenzoquinone reductase
MRAARRVGAEWSLFFCVRHAAEAPFLEEIKELGGRVCVFGADLGTRLDLQASFSTAPPDTMLYCCGPEKMMRALEAVTGDWPRQSVRFEWFAARSRSADEISETFQVVCARSGLTLSVPPASSILSVLQDAGIQVPCSCEQGVCGTCQVRVLEGRIDHRDCILSEAEKASNEMMMTCVSRALSPKLVLDI